MNILGILTGAIWEYIARIKLQSADLILFRQVSKFRKTVQCLTGGRGTDVVCRQCFHEMLKTRQDSARSQVHQVRQPSEIPHEIASLRSFSLIIPTSERRNNNTHTFFHHFKFFHLNNCTSISLAWARVKKYNRGHLLLMISHWLA